MIPLDELVFLEQSISEGEIILALDKILNIKNWATPITTKQLYEFTSLVNYLLAYVPRLGSFVAPLMEIHNYC